MVNDLAIDFATSTSGGRITATARGAITQSGAITTGSESNWTAQSSDGNTDYDITLENTSNNFVGNLKVTAANVSIQDTGTTTISATNVSGNYSLTTTGGVTDNGAINIEGTTTISSPGSNIALSLIHI